MDDQAPTQTPPAATAPKLGPVFVGFLVWFFQSTFVKVVCCFFLMVITIVITAKLVWWMVMPEFHAPDVIKILPKIRKAEDAIRPIQFGTSGCTGTIIGPWASSDEKIDILTAAHCVKLNAVGKLTMPDGRTVSVKCVSRDPASDAAWLTADNPGYDVPFLLLADGFPQEGEVVWHQGFGRDKPGNRESGKFVGPADKGLKAAFRLSVSPGDSGGGIIVDSAGRVVSPVCCTDTMSAMGNVWGASPMAAAKIRPRRTVSDEEPPLFYPVQEMSVGHGPPIVRAPKGDS